MVRDSDAIRLLESPKSLSVYILKVYIIIIIIKIIIIVIITIIISSSSSSSIIFIIITIIIKYTSVIVIDFLSQHPSPNHGLWEAKRVST